MAKRLTDEDKIRINEVYALCHNYTKTAAETGFSVASVRKYVIQDYVPTKDTARLIKKLTVNDIPEEVDLTPFIQSENWGNFCALTDEEKCEIEELRKELII